ncbi:hypothetical protein PVAND_010745 [Polypedilum vanderplanki]|uniref:Uncharacterized protein n=1 Tax=Polypedilum vanderplanki TaxID=319348 RepID=A0A9J6CI91_POLVA|nr:hypothetical protein PVAND_010745 [Polypedilum vanderplanki]
MPLSCSLFDIEPEYFWTGFWLCAAICGISYNIYVRLTCGKFKEKNVNLDGKTVLITGANSGLGKETAKYMAKRGARVIMACRNMKTAEEARDDIIAYSENHKVILQHLDLGSFESIRKFAARINESERKIDILIHNAGYCGRFKKSVTVEGIERTMAINVYGPFLLTHLLIDLLKKSAPSKIVIVTSKAHTVSYLNPNNPSLLNPVNCWLPTSLYANSKFAQFLLSYEMARRLFGTGVTVNLLHPGTCDSPIWNNPPLVLKLNIYIMRKFMKTIEQGIQTILYVSLSKEVDGITGKYYRDCKPRKSGSKTYNINWQQTMWEASKKMCKITEKDPQI